MRVCLLLAVAGWLGCSAQKGPTIPGGRSPLRQPPANAVGGFTLDLPSVTVPPGEQAWPCVIVPLMVD